MPRILYLPPRSPFLFIETDIYSSIFYIPKPIPFSDLSRPYPFFSQMHAFLDLNYEGSATLMRGSFFLRLSCHFSPLACPAASPMVMPPPQEGPGFPRLVDERRIRKNLFPVSIPCTLLDFDCPCSGRVFELSRSSCRAPGSEGEKTRTLPPLISERGRVPSPFLPLYWPFCESFLLCRGPSTPIRGCLFRLCCFLTPFPKAMSFSRLETFFPHSRALRASQMYARNTRS